MRLGVKCTRLKLGAQMFGKSGRNEARVASKIGKRSVRVTNRTAVAFAAVGVSLLAASAAQAQQACSNAFLGPFAAGPLAASPAGVSSVVGSTITTASTAFLLQSTAFIGSPGNPSPYQQGGGIWVRGVGGEVDVKSTANSVGGTPAPNPNTVALSCLQKVHQDFGGVQLGTDISRFNINGWNVHLGTTAGYIEARGHIVGGAPSFQSVLNIGGTPTVIGGGQFDTTTKVPFAGTYAAATKGGFFVDGLLRFEYYQNTLDAPGMNLFAQNTDAHGVSFSSSVGYQWQVPNSRWFVEPSAGVIISRVKVDPLNFVTAGTAGFTAFSGTLQVDDIKSNIGRFGVRVGTTIESGKLILQPFAAVSFWHEFGPSVTSVYQTCSARTGGGGCLFFGANPSIYSSSTTTTNFGTFGQYSLGFSAAVANTGWLAFARVDYRNGPNLEGLSATGGIRYQFTPDKSRGVTKDGIRSAEFVNWTGLYIGGYGSGLLGAGDWNYVGGGVSPRVGGYLFGGNVGYNYQTGAWVIGLEAELGKTNLIGSTTCGPLLADVTGLNAAPMFQMTCNAWANWLGIATARVGYAWERVLLYVKGGAAWTKEYVSATCNLGPLQTVNVNFGQGCTNPADVITNGFIGSSTRSGWVVGYGTEFALTRNWSARAEYNYIKFGDRNVIASDGSLLNIGYHVSEAKVGLNYRFDSGAVYK